MRIKKEEGKLGKLNSFVSLQGLVEKILTTRCIWKFYWKNSKTKIRGEMDNGRGR